MSLLFSASAPRWAALALLLSACGREAEETPFKTAGVGLDPSTIGPEPVLQGGLFEYHYIDFAGAGLPLALIGLVSYDGVTPGFSKVDPPYSVVYGQGFVVEADQPQMDVLFGTFGVPHQTPGACYTHFEPRSFISSVVDVGDGIRFAADDGSFEFEVGRRPQVYAENNQENLFPFYTNFASWRPYPMTYAEVATEGPVGDAALRTLVAPNWKHGGVVEVSFPGGLPPDQASFGSIPMPLAALGADRSHRLPTDFAGVRLSWDGPVYDADGGVDDGGSPSTCLQFGRVEGEVATAADCAAPALVRNEYDQPIGQLYTGPWDTTGGLSFEWEEPANAADETIVLGVRILGEVDWDDQYKQVARIPVQASETVLTKVEELVSLGYIDEVPSFDGVTRDKLACESEANGDFRWEPDPVLFQPDGSLVKGLEGEPTRVLAEVVCNVPREGKFTLTPEMLQLALDYGDLHGAAGAVFYFGRTTAMPLDTPDVRDAYGQRRPIAPVQVVTSSIKLGRFHWSR